MSRYNYIRDTWRVAGANTYTMDGSIKLIKAFYATFTVASHNTTTKVMTLSSVVGNLKPEGQITVLDVSDGSVTYVFSYDNMTMSGTTATLNNVRQDTSGSFTIQAGTDTGTHDYDISGREGVKIYNDSTNVISVGFGINDKGKLSAPGIWVANTAYTLGDIVTASSPDKIHQYICTTAGTSHATTEPTWDTVIGHTTADNTVVWTTELAGNGGILLDGGDSITLPLGTDDNIYVVGASGNVTIVEYK